MAFGGSQQASIGDMRERVAIQTRTDTVDANGDVTYAWSNSVIVWAKVEPIGATTQNIAERRAAYNTYQVTIRYISGLSDTCRIVWTPQSWGGNETKYLQIESIQNLDMRKRFLTLTCRDLSGDAGLQS